MFAHMPIIQSILYGAAQRGARLNDLCEAIGISISDLGDSEFKVPFQQSALTWEYCVKQTKDNLLGLHLGETATMSVLGLVGNLMQSCPNLLSAFETMTHYIDLATDMIQFEVKKTSSEIILMYNPAPLYLSAYPVSARQSVEQSMAGTLHVFSLLSERKIKPLRATFKHKRGGDLSEYHRALCGDVQFSQPGNHLVFSKEVLHAPVVSHDKSLVAFFEKILQEKKSLHKLTLTEKIKQLMRTDFQGHIPTLEAVATRLNMTSRTLQRKLESEGVSFRLIINGVQKETADELFKRKGNVNQIANLLGYSDPSAFRRAYKKWSNK